jgi:hypothetical protein
MWRMRSNDAFAATTDSLDEHMTITVDIPSDLARALEEGARRSGMSVAEFAAVLIAQAAQIHEAASRKQPDQMEVRMAALERIGSYDMRVRAGMPPLADEEISRASIYEGCGQ